MEIESIENIEKQSNGDEYFESYENLEIHEIMLNDMPRNLAYKNAILANKEFFKDKIVLDVGAGTGILSIFCAMAGAKKVYAVEASELAKLAEEIVKENKYQHIIQVVHCKIEDFTLKEDEKVDAIVSEWMGFYLLHEGMLDSVLHARDKFLKPGGLMFPQTATIYAAPCEVPSLYQHWDEICGVKMKCFAPQIRKSKSLKPEVLIVENDHLLTERLALSWLDLRDATSSELESFTLREIIGCSKAGRVQGICIWFECSFPSDNEEEIVLCTGPYSSPTHWKQTVIVLPHEQILDDIGDPVGFELVMRRSEENSRRYNLQLTMLDPAVEKHSTPCSCNYTKCKVIKKFYELHPQDPADVVVEDENEDEDIE